MARHMMRCVLLAAIAFPAMATAQEWRLGVDAGQIRSTLDPIARQSQTLATGIGYEDQAAAFRLSAGIPTPADSMRWATVGVWKRIATTQRAVTAGIDLSGSAFAFRQPQSAAPIDNVFDPFRSPTSARSTTVTGRAVAAQALPLVAYQFGMAQLQARGGVSYYDASTRDDARNRVASVAELQLALQPSPLFVLAPFARRVKPSGEDPMTMAGANWVFASGRVKVSGNFGRWMGSTDQSAADLNSWSAAAELRVIERASVTASARRQAYDPMFGTPPQSSWGVGVSYVLRQSPTPRTLPIVVQSANGVATIRLPLSLSSAAPKVAGDFNNWRPALMERDGTNWRYALTARPGVYNYAFVAPDGTWFVPEGVPGRKSDGMGGYVAVVVVR